MKTKKDTSFIGFHISIETDQLLQMNAVARNISVSQMMRELIGKWKDDHEVTEEKLIVCIVDRIKTDYMVLSLQTKVDDVEFSDRWKSLLLKKLTSSLTNKIIKSYETKGTTDQ